MLLFDCINVNRYYFNTFKYFYRIKNKKKIYLYLKSFKTAKNLKRGLVSISAFINIHNKYTRIYTIIALFNQKLVFDFYTCNLFHFYY